MAIIACSWFESVFDADPCTGGLLVNNCSVSLRYIAIRRDKIKMRVFLESESFTFRSGDEVSDIHDPSMRGIVSECYAMRNGPNSELYVIAMAGTGGELFWNAGELDLKKL
jgi:hypothetical protein